MMEDHFNQGWEYLFFFPVKGWIFFSIVDQNLCAHSFNSTLDIFEFENVVQQLSKFFEVFLEEFRLDVKHFR